MRLEQIKLVGFKSFVDPTTLTLKSDLVSVVGPNGCGKSNVIDAVRWVLGESSAKNLRGDSMTDVIFNGSGTRKPVGQASIELIFDNSDGTVGGEYASYAQISVKREVNRDCQNNYFLNGSKCRKRDIVDVFLGTGLGSKNSYAVIQQGTVSKIIESKPQDMRVYFEEAAGISVYKKRRHDTEIRMRHTTENLDRINDLRDEQLKTLERLKKQSAAAHKYREYQEELEQHEAWLLALRWKNYDTELSQYQEVIRELAVRLEEKLANRSSCETKIEKLRVMHHDKLEAFNLVQGEYYDLGAKVARCEQSLSHHRERQTQLSSELQDIQNKIQEVSLQKNDDLEIQEKCRFELEEVVPAYEEALALHEEAEEQYQEIHEALTLANEEWEAFLHTSSMPQQQAQVLRVQLEQLEKQTREATAKIESLSVEGSNIDTDEIKDKKEELQAQVIEFEEQGACIQEEINVTKSNIVESRDKIHNLQNQLNKLQQDLQQQKGTEASLLALQKAALNKEHKELNEFMHTNHLDSLSRLAEEVQVTDGWNSAVEIVLGDYLEAICTNNNFQDVAAKCNELSNGDLVILEESTTTANNPIPNSLANKVKTKYAIDILANVIAVDSLEQALSMRKTLESHQSVVTKDGVWLGKTWIRIKRGDDGRLGILEREQEINRLKESIFNNIENITELESELSTLANNMKTYEEKLQNSQKSYNDCNKELMSISMNLSSVKTKYEHMLQRQKTIIQEQDILKENLQEYSSEIIDVRSKLEQTIASMEDMEGQKERLLNLKNELKEKEHNIKANLASKKDALHSIEMSKQSLVNKLESIDTAITRLLEQLEDLSLKQENVSINLGGDDTIGALQEELDELLAKRKAADEQLAVARKNLEEFECEVATLEEERSSLENEANSIRSGLDQKKLDWQGLTVRKETIDEQLSQITQNVEELIASLPEGLVDSELVSHIEKTKERITRLGAINLAAIDEYKSELERQEYLEAQQKDLVEALTTLENAIKKIDKETKQKFKETFDTVNENFKHLFPKLFGGGRATLELTDDDLLETGVSVMAQPPGKKNSTIHLLSGGEKALTAIALVFSIFHLNPSPFCMLDEVDAPLDDANVGRYCKLIKEMSEKVQFIIITHNKIAMEIAKQLVGVTMKEPGVSRLVSVDIDEAMEMVTS